MHKYYLVGLILFTFFVISFLTNIIGPLIPEIIEDFQLSLFLVGFLPFAFFLAYGVMSIPSGIFLEEFGAKTMMLFAFLIAMFGALSFATLHSYLVAIISLFLIGSGMAILQVVLYPMLRATGGEENFAFFSVMGQLSFGLASFLSPLVYSYLVQKLASSQESKGVLIGLLEKLIPPNMEWISMYWLFGGISLGMLAVIGLSRFPELDLTKEERVGSRASYLQLIRKPVVWMYFFGIFFYVGTEQGINSWTSKFLLTYHSYDPQTVGARVVSDFWLYMTIGTLVGLLMLKLFDSRKVLSVFCAAAIISLSVALFGNGEMAIVAFPLIGFFSSVMFSIVISLGLNSIEQHHGAFSGICLSGIVGGAVWTLLIGTAGDLWGLRRGMLLLYISLGYLMMIGFVAEPLIANKTINWKKVINAE